MQVLVRPYVGAHLLLLCLLAPAAAPTSTTSSAVSITAASVSQTSSATAPAQSTCFARSINYITHRLPQQCAKSSWISPEETSVPTGDHDAPSTAIATSTTLPATSISEKEGKHTEEPTPEETLIFETPTESYETNNGASPTTDIPASSETSFSAEASSSTSIYSTTINTPSASPVATADAEPELESDSPLDNAHFLSFEEWKKQNLERAGQSAENLGERHSQPGGEARRRPPNINNALDSLGEDTEIELDFGGFVSSKEALPPKRQDDRGKSEGVKDSEKAPADEESVPPRAHGRNQHAGKTYKERFNYASFDCAANVLKTNPQCKGSSSILVENKDSYLLNECSANNKFIIVELCSDILVDTVVLGNFEFFSSMFRTFRVSVSDRYPVKMDRWKELAVFEARNSREVQAFLVEDSMIWARYLRIEFLTHFGNEYYCPVSLLRVHGTTMMEEFKNQNDASRGFEEDEEDSVESVETATVEAPVVIVETSPTSAKAVDAAHNKTATMTEEPRKDVQSEEPAGPVALDTSRTPGIETEEAVPENNSHDVRRSSATTSLQDFEAQRAIDDFLMSYNRSLGMCSRSEARYHQSNATNPSQTSNVTQAESESHDPSTAAEQSQFTEAAPVGTSPDVSEQVAKETSQEQMQSATPPASSSSTNSTSQDVPRTPPTATQPAPAAPSTQENFFKSLHKRLQLLEANATLSLQYIEEQSRILRDAFGKVEKRQLAKTTTFLENLNATVLTELQGFRQQYDQIWQSTVLELETQREQSQQQIVAVSARLSILADEVIYQKRMSIIQSLLLLVCLALVIFSRYSSSSYLEFPVVQNMLSRSQNSLRLPLESPLGSPGSTRPSSSRQNKAFNSHHTHQPSDDSTAPHSPIVEFSPPTPTSRTPSDRSVSPSARSILEDSPEKPRPLPRRPPTRPLPQGESLSSPAASSGQFRSDGLDWREDGHTPPRLLVPDDTQYGGSVRRRSHERSNSADGRRGPRFESLARRADSDRE